MFNIPKIKLEVSVSKKEIVEHRKHACSLGLPRLEYLEPHKRKIAIVCSGPSVKEHLEDLRSFDGEILAVSGAHEYLIKNEIPFQIFSNMDPKENIINYVATKQDDVTYYLASNCHPKLFEYLKDNKVVLFHIHTDGITYPEDEHKIIVGAGSVMGAIRVAKALGYRDLHLFGNDCSYVDKYYVMDEHKPKVAVSDAVVVQCDDKSYETNLQLLGIVNDFVLLYETLTNNATIKIYGDGLFKAVMTKVEKQIAHKRIQRAILAGK
jgi:hypothetical protein